MCFTPLASIITVIIEFGISGYLFYKIKDEKMYPLIIFVFLLGLYQFTEFMLCTSSNQIIWARIGFASYTFMPILLYHFFVKISGHEIKRYLYVIPIFFASLAFFYSSFINYTSCNTLHVTVQSLVFNQNLFLMAVYLLYYCLPIYGLYLFLKNQKPTTIKSRMIMISAPVVLLLSLFYYAVSSVYELNQNQTWMNTSILVISCVLILFLLFSSLFKTSKRLFYQTNVLVLSTTSVAILILYYFVPNLTLNYSSIFCQFALLYGIASLFLVNSLNGKLKKF